MRCIEVNKKEDVIIPFNHIGDPQWEVNTRLIIESLAYNWSKSSAVSCTKQEIEELEKRLETTLPLSLKQFYLVFGVAGIGEELIELKEIEYLEEIWAPDPQYGPSFTEEDLAVLPYLIAFSDYLGNGNMFCFHKETKEIYYFDHDTRPYITKFFLDFEDYLKCCLILAQTDLFGDIDQNEVDRWTEDIVIDLIGKDIIQKWRY